MAQATVSMISIIIPTLNAESTLGATLTALIPAVVEGLVREVIIVDGGSTDRTLVVADASGATVVKSPAGRGQQMSTGAAAARGPWFLFLHGDTVLEAGWERDVATFIERIETGRRPVAAAAFQFSLDDTGVMPRLVEKGVALRCWLLRLPYGDQGLLISQALYNQVGGFQPMPLMEDVAIIRRLGRARVATLRSRAITSAQRYRRDGYLNRAARNVTCLMLYLLRMPLRLIVRLYG